jgi:hypothetical protein
VAPGSFDRDLVQLLVQVPAARGELAPLADLRDIGHATLREILAALQRHPEAAPAALVHRLPGDAERGLLARLMVEDTPWPDPATVIEDMRRRLLRRQRLRRIREITQAIARAQADGAASVAELQLALQDEARLVRELAEPKSHSREAFRS